MKVIRKEIKRRINPVNTCYDSGQKLFYFCLLSKNVEIGIFETNLACGVVWMRRLVSDARRMFGSGILLVFGLRGGWCCWMVERTA
jgi:hypothetical protein